MTVPSQEMQIRHNCDGVSAVFPVPFYFLANPDLHIILTDASGVQTTLTLGTDYNVTGAGVASGGDVTTLTIYPEGSNLYIWRVVPITQETAYQRNDPFPERAHEKALDKLTMICQQMARIIGLLPGVGSRALLLGDADVDGSGRYRANGNRIQDLSAPVDMHDAVNKQHLVESLASLAADGSGQFVVERLADTSDTDNGAAMVGFNPEKLYAIGTIGYEAGQSPSVNSFFGVDSTGTADSAAAINDAIAAAAAMGVKSLRFSGVYKCLSEVVLASDMHYQADRGSTINFTTAEFGMLIPDGSRNIEINGFTLAGQTSRMISGATAGTASNIRIHDNDISGATLQGTGYSAGIFLNGATDCWIYNNQLHGNGRGRQTNADNADILVWTGENQRVRIFDNTCTSTDCSFGIACYNMKNSFIKGNYVNGMVTGANNNDGYGIVIYESIASTTYRNIIQGNTVENTEGAGIYSASSTYLSIVGNICMSNGLAQSDVSLAVGAIAFNTIENIVVSGNNIRSSGKDGICGSVVTDGVYSNNVIELCAQHGIHLRSTGQRIIVNGNSVQGCYDNIYSDNATKTGITISNNNLTASKLSNAGLYIGSANHSSVIGNVILNSVGIGLSWAAGSNNMVANNLLVDNGTGGSTFDGMVLAVTTSLISANKSGNTGSSGQRYGIYSTGNNCTVTDNQCINNETDGMFISGSNIQRSGNRYTTGATQGLATLVAGGVLIETTEIRDGDLVLISANNAGGATGDLATYAIISEVSFRITSANNADERLVAWQIVH